MRARTLRTMIVGAAAGAAILTMGAGVAAAAEGGPTFPPRDERCKVPPLLFQVAAVVDVDSLEGCGFFEDPNVFENRKAAGQFNDRGLFTQIFG